MAAKKAKKKELNYIHGLCKVSVAPIRKRADDREEMTSQLLFGEGVELLIKKNKSWVKIKCQHDGYEGWMDPKQLLMVDEKVFDKHLSDFSCALDHASTILHGDENFPIVSGSTLSQFDGLNFKLAKENYVYNGQVIDPKQIQPTPELISKVAKKYLHAPYLWGGRSPFGIDCSGFTQVVFKFFNIVLPRDAYQQVEYGEVVDFHEHAQIGDLAFFVNKEGRIHHVGIVLDNKHIIHASGRVRIDRLDHFGIFHHGKRSYTHTLRIIKRII